MVCSAHLEPRPAAAGWPGYGSTHSNIPPPVCPTGGCRLMFARDLLL